MHTNERCSITTSRLIVVRLIHDRPILCNLRFFLQIFMKKIHEESSDLNPVTYIISNSFEEFLNMLTE